MKFSPFRRPAIFPEVFFVGVLLAAAGLWPIGGWVGNVTGGAKAHFGIEMKSPASSVAQLFYSTGDEFNEAQSDSVLVKPGANVLVFSVRARAVNSVRFDPLTVGGTVEIGRVWIEDETGERKIPLSVAGFEPANQISEIQEVDGGLRVTMPSTANDPQLVRSWPSLLVFPRTPFPWAAGALFLFGVGAAALSRFGDGEWRAVRWWMPALATGLVAGFFLWPLHRTQDLPLWDEANYLGWGRNFFTTHTLGDIASSPGYHLWYALLARVSAGSAPVFISDYALKCVLVVVTGLLAHRWLGSWIAAGVVAAGLAASQWQLTFPLLVYHAAFVCYLCALVTADRSRVAALGFVALAALTRLEYALAGVAAILLWLVLAVRVKSSAKKTAGPLFDFRKSLAWAPLLLALFICWHIHGWRLGSERGWFAFQQHYAVGLAEAGSRTGINPWLGYGQVIAEDFPGASSLRDAIRVNRPAVIRHVGRNLTAAPLRMVEVFATTHPGAGRWIFAGTLALLALAAAFFDAGEERVSFRSWLSSRRWSITLAVAGLAAITPGLVVYAKTAYLLPAVPIFWLALGMLTAAARARGGDRRFPKFGAAGVVAVAMIAMIETAPRPLSRMQPQPVRENLAVIRGELRPPAKLLGTSASSYAVYLGRGFTGVEPLASETGGRDTVEDGKFEALIARVHPDGILVTDEWRTVPSFDRNGFDALAQRGWRKVALNGGVLLVRAPL
ncbi:MAG: hypothetical protein JWM88_2768 [Verrucomicrobia bacterium]|nr:hypothetical protein [Verrucomicrobiota bacterium]